MPKKRPAERPSRFLTQEQARMLCDAHEVDSLLSDEEETELLEQNNPGMLDAYLELQAIADGSD